MSIERNGDLFLNLDETKNLLRNIINPDEERIRNAHSFVNEWGGTDDDYHEDGSISFDIPDLFADEADSPSSNELYVLSVKNIRIDSVACQWSKNDESGDPISVFQCSEVVRKTEMYEVEDSIADCA